MPHLFEPLKIKSITLRNRIGLSPMCMYSYSDGYSNEWQLIHLGSRAAGGAGLIITEATAVEPRGRITPFDAGLWSDEHIKPLSLVTDSIKKNGAVPAIQLAHAGRKGSSRRPWEPGKPYGPGENPGWQTIGPSAIRFNDDYPVPQAMTIEDINFIKSSFISSAKRALTAGFEWLEIHAAHGYLLHSFYSPISNQRTDQYGVSFENRTRLVMEITCGVREVWPENLPLTVRISGSDWFTGGWTVEDSVNLSKMLKNAGVDMIDCSSGGNAASAVIPAGPGYQVPISEAVKHGAGIMTSAVGLISSPFHADEIIRNNRADMVLLGREMLRDPYWPLHAAQTLKQPAPIPVQYLRGF
ncbi:MAG: NADH:flavin oxidoreductase/NADH oxidase [Chloroflexota bacterium]